VTTDPIDRAVRALTERDFDRSFTDEQWAVIRLSNPSSYAARRVTAMAVMRALREPTPEMVEAANAVRVHGADLHDFVAHECAAPVWHAMIDHLLATES
jgi:hypothetical protein